jgi:RNA polymerase sigma factor (TIGR02999 family)
MVSAMTNASEDVTRLLVQWSGGDREALDRLLPFIYGELHRIAERQFRRERVDNTLQPTALVNELYLRLIKQSGVNWKNRSQFFGIAAKIMRQVLVDRARERNATKRGSGNYKLDLTDVGDIPEKTETLELLALDQALERLASFDEQQTRIVEMRFFGGLSIEETAEAMGISRATVKRDWALAKAWLFLEIKK